MQLPTAAPRDGLTATQITHLLQAPALNVDFGLEQLDGNDVFVADISADLQGGEVSRNCLDNVHGKLSLSVSRALAWGAVRVRPYMILTADGVSARWNLGVYVLTSPDDPVGLSPATYTVTGKDKLYLLQNPIGDSRQVISGSNVLTAVRTAITDSGAGGAVLFDGTGAAKTLSSDLIWPLTQLTQPTWLQVINDLLAAIGYRGLWCDENGAFRSEPYVNPTARPAEFPFTADDPNYSLVSQDRTRVQDLWAAPNWWRFIQKDVGAAPTEGAGQYTVQNTSTGPASQSALGYVRRAAVQYLTATDQASLQAQGDQIVANDMQVITTLALQTGPWPGAQHFDVYSLQDTALGGLLKVEALTWQMPLNGDPVTWKWRVVG